jgi:hypothetical protein
VALPNSKPNAAHVSNVYGIANTGKRVFKLHMPIIGPTAITITSNVIPKINLNNADVIAKIPPKDKRANNLPLLY